MRKKVSAMKLVSETGELYGAARIDSILYNEDIRDFREKLKSAKKEYDDYLAADWDGRQAMVPQILQWKLEGMLFASIENVEFTFG